MIKDDAAATGLKYCPGGGMVAVKEKWVVWVKVGGWQRGAAALLRDATHVISRLRSHQGHLVVAAAEQSPDSVQFTLDRKERWREGSADSWSHLHTQDLPPRSGERVLASVHGLLRATALWVLMRNKGHNQEIYQSFTSFLMSPVIICSNI